MRILRALLILTAVGLCLGCSTQTPTNMRERMLISATADYPDFPDNELVQLTQFAYIGDVQTSDGPLRVVLLRSVLTGMPSPRGKNAILFFSSDGSYVGRLGCTYPQFPIWCEGSLVYLWGYCNFGYEGGEGNAWDLSDGFGSARLIESPRYGSWQGED